VKNVSFTQALQMACRDWDDTLRRVENVPLADALGRVTAAPLICRKDLPAFTNSAMDGFAFRHAELGKPFAVAATVLAGDHPVPILQQHECYRIMTGAPLPSDADTVVPIEQCIQLDEKHVVLPEEIRPGNAVRYKGEEQRLGDELFGAGEQIGPGHIAMSASQGSDTIACYRPLRIGIASSGDELCEPSEPCGEDGIYNANSSGILAILQRNGFEANYLGKIPDQQKAVETYVKRIENFDVVITTGGASKGDADFLKEAYRAAGVTFWFDGVAIKPGHPTMMGALGKTLVIALPGNPLAALLNLTLLGIPAIRKKQGMKQCMHRTIMVTNGEDFKAKGGRTNVVLGTYAEGIFRAFNRNRYGSGMLTPYLRSNAIALLGPEKENPQAGELLEIILL